MKKAKNGLNNFLSNQRYAKDKSGLGYYKFENSSKIKKSIFVKTSHACNYVQSRNVCDDVQPRNAYNNNYFYDHKKRTPNTT